MIVLLYTVLYCHVYFCLCRCYRDASVAGWGGVARTSVFVTSNIDVARYLLWYCGASSQTKSQHSFLACENQVTICWFIAADRSYWRLKVNKEYNLLMSMCNSLSSLKQHRHFSVKVASWGSHDHVTFLVFAVETSSCISCLWV